MTVPAVIDRFVGRYAALSNFAAFPVVMDGVTYPTVEHAFQAAKTLNPHMRAGIRDAHGPGSAKRLGRSSSLRLRPDWDRVRVDVMRDLLRQKFTQHADARRVLIDTGVAALTEGNTWHDQFWGDCRCGGTTCVNPGANTLGQLLAEVRTELHHHHHRAVSV